jgi:hypothetical protein
MQMLLGTQEAWPLTQGSSISAIPPKKLIFNCENKKSKKLFKKKTLQR